MSFPLLYVSLFRVVDYQSLYEEARQQIDELNKRLLEQKASTEEKAKKADSQSTELDDLR